jgi:hypothetical protein
MDITGLDIMHISSLMEVYLKEYFNGQKELSYNDCLFAEVIHMAVEEVEHLIPVSDKLLFQKDEMINGAAGYVTFHNTDDETNESYTVMLIMNDSLTQALYLYIMNDEEPISIENALLVKDLTKEDEKLYSISIIETLSREITIGSASVDEALETVKERYNNSEIILDADDYKDVDFFVANE